MEILNALFWFPRSPNSGTRLWTYADSYSYVGRLHPKSAWGARISIIAVGYCLYGFLVFYLGLLITNELELFILYDEPRYHTS